MIEILGTGNALARSTGKRMLTHEEMIAAARHCADEDVCDGCPLAKAPFDCVEALLRQLAAELEKNETTALPIRKEKE